MNQFKSSIVRSLVCEGNSPSRREIELAQSVASTEGRTRLVWSRDGYTHQIEVTSGVSYEEILNLIDKKNLEESNDV